MIEGISKKTFSTLYEFILDELFFEKISVLDNICFDFNPTLFSANLAQANLTILENKMVTLNNLIARIEDMLISINNLYYQHSLLTVQNNPYTNCNENNILFHGEALKESLTICIRYDSENENYLENFIIELHRNHELIHSLRYSEFAVEELKSYIESIIMDIEKENKLLFYFSPSTHYQELMFNLLLSKGLNKEDDYNKFSDSFFQSKLFIQAISDSKINLAKFELLLMDYFNPYNPYYFQTLKSIPSHKTFIHKGCTIHKFIFYVEQDEVIFLVKAKAYNSDTLTENRECIYHMHRDFIYLFVNHKQMYPNLDE